ncbi:MAG: hypothetical protein Kapaf2KO_16150 [Candidatus Kapaibacteriales bacterium]
MKEFLIDTNILIYYLNKRISEVNAKLLYTKFDRCSVSVVSRLELLCWRELKQEEASHINTFMETFSNIDVNIEIAEMAADIKKVHRLKLADSIIEATAIINGMDLYSNDTEFTKIKELNTISIPLNYPS